MPNEVEGAGLPQGCHCCLFRTLNYFATKCVHGEHERVLFDAHMKTPTQNRRLMRREGNLKSMYPTLLIYRCSKSSSERKQVRSKGRAANWILYFFNERPLIAFCSPLLWAQDYFTEQCGRGFWLPAAYRTLPILPPFASYMLQYNFWLAPDPTLLRDRSRVTLLSEVLFQVSASVLTFLDPCVFLEPLCQISWKTFTGLSLVSVPGRQVSLPNRNSLFFVL